MRQGNVNISYQRDNNTQVEEHCGAITKGRVRRKFLIG